MKKKVLIVGAGTAGLSAGIRLQSQGYDVEIFEKNPLPGGKMYRIEQEGFKFDVGPTIVMMPELYKDVYRAAGLNPDDYIEFIRLEPMYDVYFKDNPYRHYSLSSDLVQLNQMLEEKGQETSAGFYQFLSSIYDRYLVALNHFIRRPFRYKRDMYNPFMIKQAMKLKTLNSATDMMAQFIPEEDVQQMMAFQTLYIGVSPNKGPSLYNIIPMIEILYGVYMLKGGMYAMAAGMSRAFQELGGKIHCGEEVQEILIENGKAKGLQLGDRQVFGDYIISNADFPYTMTKLIKDKKTRGKYTPEKIQKMDYSCSCLIFYWGVEGEFEELQTHNFIVCKDLDENLNRIFDGRRIEDPSIYLHIPSKADSSMAPVGHSSFYLLIPVSELGTAKYEYDEENISHYREQALQTLENLPGLEHLREKIKTEMIYRPQDFAADFSAYRGATFGLQPTLKQSNHWRPQSKSLQCEGLYFTGSSTHPGAGVPIALEGGKICAEELRRDEPSDSFS